MNLEMLSIAQVHGLRWPPEARFDEKPIRSNNDVLQRQPVGIVEFSRQLGKASNLISVDVGASKKKDRPINRPQRLHDILLERARQICRIVLGRFNELMSEAL